MRNANTPAHPVTFEHEDATSEAPGLTKREYFAALAMQGLLSSQHDVTASDEIAGDAVMYADALLDELENTE